jgi:preprotein translocase subunit SecY
MTPFKIMFLIASFIFIVAGSILITQAQRRIPIQQAQAPARPTNLRRPAPVPAAAE